MSTDWKRKLVALTVVLGLHLVWMLCLHTAIQPSPAISAPYREGLSSVTFTVTPAPAPSGAPLGSNSIAAQPVPGYSNVTGIVQSHSPSKYLESDNLDTRAAPRALVWNIDKQFLRHGEPTSLVFRVWVSATGTIDALEPYTHNGKQWLYDGLAKSLQTTPMVPASLRTQAVASAMTVELLVDSDD